MQSLLQHFCQDLSVILLNNQIRYFEVFMLIWTNSPEHKEWFHSAIQT